MKSKQGQKANEAGLALEEKARELLSKKGVIAKDHHYTGAYFPFKKGNKRGDGMSQGEILIVSSMLPEPVMVECRGQQVAGTADEKFPLLYLNCLEAEYNEIIIVIEGNGFKDGAVEWLYNAVSNKLYRDKEKHANKNIQVMTINEFSDWVKANFSPMKIMFS